MSLYYIWNLIRLLRTCYHWVIKDRNSRNYPALTVASKFARFESIWLQHVRNTAREGVQNTHQWSGPTDDATDEWLLQWRRDPAWPIFTALHGIQTWSSDENSVRLSVRPSVKRVDCDKTEERSVQIFIPYERLFSLVFSEEEWLVGVTHSTWNFGSNWPRWSEIADFRSIFARSASAVTPSEKSSININTNPLRAFQWAQAEHHTLSLSPKGGSKTQMSKIWTIRCDNSETVRDRMSVTINYYRKLHTGFR